MALYARWLLFFFLVVGLKFLFPGGDKTLRSAPIDETPANAPPITLYDSDPNHLWNRLYRALLDGALGEGTDEPWQLDPFVRQGTSDRARAERIERERLKNLVPILDEFLAKRGETLVRDPRKRAMLQRDLWAWFDGLEIPRTLLPPAKPTGNLELAGRLVKILPRLALTIGEIKSLPNNFAEAVAAKKFPEWMDAGRLWDGTGPWVLLGTEDHTPLARTHVAFFGNRSAFLVFLRDPEGREATLKHLSGLRPGGVSPRMAQAAYFALARRMQLIDERGLIATTTVIESLEIRGLGNHVFKLSRREFLADRSSLLPLGVGDTERSAIALLGRNAGQGQAHVLSSCSACHMPDTMESYARFFGPHPSVRPGVIASDQESEVSHQRHLKMASYEWGLLQGLGRSRASD